MLLRNKTMVCTVPRRGTLQCARTGTSPVAPELPSTPEAPFIDPYLSESIHKTEQDNEQPRFKLLVFRMPESLKTDFKMSLLKNHVDIQHTFEAFAEIFIAWANGEKIPDPMKAIIRRTITLMNGV